MRGDTLNPKLGKAILALMVIIFLAAMLGGNSNKETITVYVDGNGEPFIGSVSVVDGPPENRVYHSPEVFRDTKGGFARDFTGENITVYADVRRDENAFPGKRLTISLLGKDNKVIARDSTLGYDLIWVSNDPELSY